MVVVLLPSLLAAEAGGRKQFEVEAETVADALRALPVASLVFDERGSLRALVNVYVDGVDARERDGLDTVLAGSEEIRLVAAIAGGAVVSSEPSDLLGRRRRPLELSACVGGLPPGVPANRPPARCDHLFDKVGELSELQHD